MKLLVTKNVRIPKPHVAGEVITTTDKSLAAQLVAAGQATDDPKAIKAAEAAAKKAAADGDK